MNAKRVLTIKYIFYQLFYWGSLCTVLSYTMTFMLAEGYSSSYIGRLFAITNIGSVLVQSIVASVADSRPDKWTLKRINIGFVILMLLGSSAMIVLKSASIAFVVLVCVGMIACSAMQPFVNSLSVLIEKKGIKLNFGLCRSAGSLGYALASTLVGRLLLYFPVKVIPSASVILLIGLLISSLVIGNGDAKGMKNAPVSETSDSEKDARKSSDDKRPAKGTIAFMMEHKRFTVFLIGTALVFYMHTMLATYMIQIMENVGGNASHMGIAISIAAILELPTMLLFKPLVKRFECRKLLQASGVFFTLKALFITISGSVGMVYAASIFQLGAYALYTPAIVYYVSHLFGEEDMNKGQALVTAAVTIGSIFSSLINGQMIDQFSVQTTLYTSLIISAIGTVIMFFSVEKFPSAAASTE